MSRRSFERSDDAVVGEARWHMAGAVLAAMVLTNCVLERSYSAGSVKAGLAAGNVTTTMPCATPAA